MRVLAAAVGGALALALTPVAAALAPSGVPTISSTTTRATPGASIIVQLSGWAPQGVLTVQTCGNDALRGSADCDLVASESVSSGDGSPTLLRVYVGRPPVTCPCVLRASDTATQEVATMPFDVVGHEVGPLARTDPATAPPLLSVTAALRERPTSFLGRLRRVLGGPSHRDLRLEVHNTTPYPLSGVVVTAAVGRHPTGGAPLDAPAPFDLAVGGTHIVTLPVTLVAPVHGRYVAAGRAFVGGRAVAYSVSVRTTPWGLVVLAGVVLGAIAVAVLVALRRRREGAEAGTGTDGEREVTTSGTLREHPFPDPSPETALS